MLIGVISDCHGNPDGLQVCFKFLQKMKVQKILYLGDAIGYFPHAAEVCELLLQAKAHCIMGNTEAMYLGLLPLPPEKEEVLRIGKYGKGIPKRWLRAVETAGPMQSLFLGGRSLLLVHATLDDPLEGRLVTTPSCGNADITLAGHTHRPLLYRTGTQLYLNPGSCGYPRDHGTLLSLALLDTEQLSASIWRLPFSYSPAILKTVHEMTKMCTKRKCSTVSEGQKDME